MKIINPKGVLGYLYKQFFSRKYTVPREQFYGELKDERILTIFVHYNANDIIDESDVEYIRRLQEVSEIILVTNSKISESEFSKYGIACKYFFQRSNIGYDFGAWKDAIRKYKTEIQLYDYIILANNSVFYPAYNLGIVLGYMINNRAVDFWGITAFTENRYFKAPERRFFDNKPIPQHIQSYFILLKNCMINEEFFAFWDEMEYPQCFVEAVENGELTFTTYFADKGYTWDVLIRETKSETTFHFDGPDMTKNEPDVLLYYGCPFIKKKAIGRISVKQIDNIKRILSNSNFDLSKCIFDGKHEKGASKTYRFLNRVFTLTK